MPLPPPSSLAPPRSHRRVPKWTWRVAVVLAALSCAGEAAVRWAGLIDFPIYHADAVIGYVPAPQQHGSFRNVHDWRFNALSMAGPEFAPTAAADVLLVGDSVVLGGNGYRAPDRLGPQLARITGDAVWPVAAGSWSLLNELTYLQQHAGVVAQVDKLVWVLNSADFGDASSWACETTHPRSRPVFGLLYIVRKLLTDSTDCGQTPAALRVPPLQWQPQLQAWAKTRPADGAALAVFLYPNRSESQQSAHLAQNLEQQAGALQRALGAGVAVYSVGRDPRWHAGLYRDSIHPTEQGMAVLAAVIASPDPATRLPR